MQREFWNDIGRTSENGGTSRRFLPTPRASDAERGGRVELLHMAKGAKTPRGPLTSFAVASHVRTSATPDAEPDLKAIEADCFSRPFAWFDNSDRESSCWKTWQRCLLGDWIEFSESWPRSGMMRNGTAYRLRPLVPRISGTGYSLLPTPNASDGNQGGTTQGNRKSPNLSIVVHSLPLNEVIENQEASGSLNPTWVEALMGFPISWTDISEVD